MANPSDPPSTTTTSTTLHTSSQTGTFNFAYGSNLSPYQVSLRLQASRESSIPVAVARLDSFSWIICSRGYGNIVALPPPPPPSSTTTATISDPIATQVYGIIYNLSPRDEETLDEYEGHDPIRNPTPTPNPSPSEVERRRKPFLQGGWDYNKLYVPVTVTKWLQDPREYGVDVSSGDGGGDVVTVSVYVDELRTEPGIISFEYIGRMNRAIRESVALGVPERWVETVIRPFVPSGIEVADEQYIGDRDGFIEGENGRDVREGNGSQVTHVVDADDDDDDTKAV
ncbi:hypothetical protein PV10_07443 [Exophiala mesophila]|uniref:gamma-glutamylcyclotransferase n=1 Tax=Exophiala mesophila TaxID=212818 RepID=A0A0D1Z5K6_EXOME|nr:uncharacterized protein PV10_07443 [Exophiala mesophila]KIV90102.1 hypothetical protein PV10_07443 [Exophiala mesophila]